MKLWERVVERRISEVTRSVNNTYGFMPWKSTIDALFALSVDGEVQRRSEGDALCVCGPETVSRSPCALLKLDFLTSACIFCMHWSESPALVRRKAS